MATNGNGDGDGFQIIQEKSIPDVYSDSVGFEVSLYGVTLEFGQQQRRRGAPSVKAPHIPRIRVHMSPQHAKVLAKVFVKNMRAYEDKVGKIPIPEEVLKSLEIEEDW